MDLIGLIRRKIDERIAVGNDDSFYISNLSDVRLKYQKWMEKFPRVTPFYAMKCNNDAEIVKLLAELGTGFDCASKKELDQILKMGVHPDRIIYANPVKQLSHLKFAADSEVKKLTFDSPAELERIKKIHPDAKVVLRIRYDSKNTVASLGIKFGCDPITEGPELIKMCKDLEMNLIGISFHTGSPTLEYEIYDKALRAVRQLFDVATDIGFKLYFVDIGGGFMCFDDVSSLDNYARYINQGIETYFPKQYVNIISEPGQYFAASASLLVVQIILKKVSKDGHINYYINDSIYQSFLFQYMYQEHQNHHPLKFEIIRRSEHSRPIERPSTIWGQTCNSNDIIIGNQMIPELDIGDTIVFKNMGAYAMVGSTHFNGLEACEVIYIDRNLKMGARLYEEIVL